MREVDCFDIKSIGGMRHGFIEREGEHWIYHREGINYRENGGEVVKKDKFTLFRNTTYPDDAQLYAGLAMMPGVTAKIDWEKLEVSTSTGVTLKLTPNDF